MKSFIAALTQTERTVVQRSPLPITSKLRARDAIRADKYLTLLGTDCLTTAALAAEVEEPTSNVLKQLNRLACRGLIFKVGMLLDACGRPALLWKAGYRPDAGRVPEKVHTSVYLTAICARNQKDTQQLATTVGTDYYTALERLKRLEVEGLVRRVGVNRSVKESPSIIWAVV